MSIPSYVVVPSDCPMKKIEAAKSYGATVLLSGTAPEDRVQLANEVRSSTGSVLVPAADHADIVLGQATAIQEFLQQVATLGDRLDAIIVPSGGGGLLVGAMIVGKPQGVKIFAAEPEHGGPGLVSALRTGQRALGLDGTPTIADGLRSLTGKDNWEHIKQAGSVDQIFAVTEDQIKQTLKLAIEELGFLLEPSAVVALAAALFDPVCAQHMSKLGDDARIGIVLTGGNIGVAELLGMVPNLNLEAARGKKTKDS